MHTQAQPLVSVIIPTFNQSHYLAMAIRSALTQSWPEREVIVVDDGSTDETPEILAHFDGLIRVIRQTNRGPSAARNTGIKVSLGQFVALLDSDDYWAPQHLSTVMPLLVGYPHRGAAFTGWHFVDSSGDQLPQVGRPGVPKFSFREALIRSNFLVPSAVVIRKSCLDQTGLFDESLSACEDWDLWLRISALWEFAGTQELTVFYRVHGNSISQDAERMQANRIAVARKHFGGATGGPSTWPHERRRVYGGVYLRGAVDHLCQRHLTIAAECLRQALYVEPELGERLDTFYEVACALQPVGYRGDFSSIRLDETASVMFALLESVFNDRGSAAPMAGKSQAYGQTCIVLGLLAYGAGQMDAARRYLVRAVCQYPVLLSRRRWWSAFGRSCLTRRVIAWLQVHLRGKR